MTAPADPGPGVIVSEPGGTAELRVLVNSRTHDEDLRSLARWLPRAAEFADRIRVLGQLPETGSFDVLTAGILITVPALEYEQIVEALATMIGCWQIDRSIAHLQRGELNAPVLVTVVFPGGAAIVTEGD